MACRPFALQLRQPGGGNRALRCRREARNPGHRQKWCERFGSDCAACRERSAGVFSSNLSGSGQGAILNQDLTVNSSTSPAAQGSVVVIYTTGEGQTMPSGIDGKLATGPVYSRAATARLRDDRGSSRRGLICRRRALARCRSHAGQCPDPAGLASGDNALTISVGSAASQPELR